MKKPRNECRFCRRRRCDYRIVSDDGEFDEVACAQHGGELERLADAALNGAPRLHSMGTDAKRRGRSLEESAGEVSRFRTEYARFEAIRARVNAAQEAARQA